jgi:hypothetical protein
MRLSVLVGSIAALVTWGSLARAEEPSEPPKGPVARAQDALWPKFLPAPPRPEPPSGSTLLITGALLFGVPYVSGATTAAVTGFANHSNWMLVPLWGPVAVALKRESGCSAETKGQLGCGDTWLSATLIADAVIQTAGLGALLTGAIVSAIPGSAPYMLGRVRVVPVATRRSAGLFVSF